MSSILKWLLEDIEINSFFYSTAPALWGDAAGLDS